MPILEVVELAPFVFPDGSPVGVAVEDTDDKGLEGATRRLLLNVEDSGSLAMGNTVVRRIFVADDSAAGVVYTKAVVSEIIVVTTGVLTLAAIELVGND
jgi:hypothetical protein